MTDLLAAYAGRMALVTGFASGIGRAVAERLVAAGAKVVGLDRRDSDLAVERFVRVDLADEDSITSAAATMPEEISYVFNCAGVSSGAADPATVVRVNFLGLRALVEAIVPRIPSGGAVVSTSSLAGFRYRSNSDKVLGLVRTAGFDEGCQWLEEHAAYVRERGGYPVSKEAVVLYTMERCWTLGARGVRINAVAPGITETPMLADTEKAFGPSYLPVAPEPLGRRSTAGEQADVLVFLNSPWAGYVNGQTIWSDGGSISARLPGALLE